MRMSRKKKHQESAPPPADTPIIRRHSSQGISSTPDGKSPPPLIIDDSLEQVPSLNLHMKSAGTGSFVSTYEVYNESPLFYSMFVHILTHADFEFTLRLPEYPQVGEMIARPHYSYYKPIAEGLLSALASMSPDALVPVELSGAQGIKHPIGLKMREPLIGLIPFTECRLRSRDLTRVLDVIEQQKQIRLERLNSKNELVRSDSKNDEKKFPECEITGLYFPMLSVLLPKWISLSSPPQAKDKRRKLVYFITGSGVPRNRSHSKNGNCTFPLARLIEQVFLNRFYPDMVLSVLHSGDESDLFSFNANVKFMNDIVRPTIFKKRSELAQFF
jgi:hypothetical protein